MRFVGMVRFGTVRSGKVRWGKVWFGRYIKSSIFALHTQKNEYYENISGLFKLRASRCPVQDLNSRFFNFNYHGTSF